MVERNIFMAITKEGALTNKDLTARTISGWLIPFTIHFLAPINVIECKSL